MPVCTIAELDGNLLALEQVRVELLGSRLSWESVVWSSTSQTTAGWSRIFLPTLPSLRVPSEKLCRTDKSFPDHDLE